MHHRSLNLSIGLVPALCVWCYLYYPAWRSDVVLKDIPGLSIYLAAFIVALVLLIKLAVVLSDQSLLQNTHKSNNISLTQTQLRWPGFAVGVIVTIFVVAQVQFLDLPVLSGPDEAGHVFRKLRQWHLFVHKDAFYPAVAFLLACVASILCFACFALPIQKEGPKRIIAPIVLLIILFIVLLGLTEVVQMSRGWGNYYRFPPLRNVLIQPSILAFGSSEVSLRLVSTILGALTSIVVYKILRDDGKPIAGFVAASICLSCPMFFMYGHLDYRDIGGAFFVALCIHFLLKYLRTWNPIYLSISCWAVAAGYLERRPVLIILLVCGVAVLAELVSYWRQRNTPLLNVKRGFARLLLSRSLFLLCTVIAVAPWLYISRDTRPYVFFPENFLNPELLSAYIKVLASMLVWPVLIMLVAGLIVTAVKRNRIGILAFLSFFVFYVLFTGDQPKWIPQRRFVINFLPCLALIGALSVTLLPSNRTRTIFAALCLVPMIIGVVGWSKDSYPLMLDKRGKIPQTLPRYPFDQLVRSIATEGLTEPRFCLPTRLTHNPLSIYWYKLYPQARLRFTRPAKKHRTDEQTLESVQKICTKENTDYVILLLRRIGTAPFTVYRIGDIANSQIQTNTVEGFDVAYSYENGRYKVVAMRPK